MTYVLVVDENERRLLVAALRTSHTWCLDALGQRIHHDSDLMPALTTRARILRLSAALDAPIDDSYRMRGIAEYLVRTVRLRRELRETLARSSD